MSSNVNSNAGLHGKVKNDFFGTRKGKRICLRVQFAIMRHYGATPEYTCSVG